MTSGNRAVLNWCFYFLVDISSDIGPIDLLISRADSLSAPRGYCYVEIFIRFANFSQIAKTWFRGKSSANVLNFCAMFMKFGPVVYLMDLHDGKDSTFENLS